MPLIDVVDVVGAAREVRRRAGLSKPPYSTHELMKHSYPDVAVTGEEMPPVVFEVLIRSRDLEQEHRTIVYNRSINNDARRVGIAHALGHIQFDTDEARKCTATVGQLRRVALEEQRADIFAGELLCPLSDLDSHFSDVRNLFPRKDVEKRLMADLIDRCASRFKVPSGFIRWRLYDLAYLRKSSFCLAE